MRVLPDFQRSCHKRGLFAASSLLLLLATQTIAQSGRRAPKPTPTPVTTPESDKKQPATPSGGRELARKTSLIVAKQSSSKHLRSEDTIFAEFVKTLSEFKNVTAFSLGDVKHDAAVKRAKSEKESIVVLVEFDVDEFQQGTLILNAQDLDVKVLVFAPSTGKKLFEGKVYYKAVGGPMLKRDNWPSGTPIRITTEAVGIEAAEQVRDWLLVEERRRKN